MAGDDNNVAGANHVAVKMPTFWPKNPRSWFISVEAQFHKAKITQDDTKYWHVLAALPCEVIDSIHSVTELDTPSYTALKEKLLGSYSPSSWQAIWHVLDMPNLATDQKPSALLDTMLAALPSEIKSDNKMFHAVFLRKLPTYLRAPLMSSTFTTVQEMAAKADQIWGAQDHQAAHTAATISSQQRSPSRGRDRSRRPPKERRAATPGKPGLCWYHAKFGKKAHSCEQPCTWKQSGNAVAADDSDC